MFEGSFCTMEIHYVYQVKCGICQNWVPNLSKEAVTREDKGLKEPGLLGQPGIYQQPTKASNVLHFWCQIVQKAGRSTIHSWEMSVRQFLLSLAALACLEGGRFLAGRTAVSSLQGFQL